MIGGGAQSWEDGVPWHFIPGFGQRQERDRGELERHLPIGANLQGGPGIADFQAGIRQEEFYQKRAPAFAIGMVWQQGNHHCSAARPQGLHHIRRAPAIPRLARWHVIGRQRVIRACRDIAANESRLLRRTFRHAQRDIRRQCQPRHAHGITVVVPVLCGNAPAGILELR